MTITEKAENFIFQLFKDKLSSDYIYHNFNHTLKVVSSIKTLIKGEKINDHDAELLLIAGWFHDAGYINGCTGHEDESSKIATAFLEGEKYPEEKIQTVQNLIKATAFQIEPKHYLEEVLRDADCAHFASKDYFTVAELLRGEFEMAEQRTINDLDWAIENRKMFSQKHRYYTRFAKEHWQPLKDENLAILQEKIKVLQGGKKKKDKGLDHEKKLKKLESPERGIETMFRVTLNNHTQLSQIADSKANILLSVNAIIISIALSTLIPKLDSPGNAHLIMPTFVLLMFSVVSIIFAILSTRPKVTSGSFTIAEVNDRKVNLLFFGNFFKMPLEDYQWAMKEMMKDKEYLYDSLIKDLYYLGLVLNKKYKLLRITYNIFMVGIVISVIAFVFAFKYYSV